MTLCGMSPIDTSPTDFLRWGVRGVATCFAFCVMAFCYLVGANLECGSLII